MAELEIEQAKELERARSDQGSDEERPLLKEEEELRDMTAKLDDDDPMKEAMLERQREVVRKAIGRWEKETRKRLHGSSRRHRDHRHHHNHRHYRQRQEPIENGHKRRNSARRPSSDSDSSHSYRQRDSREKSRRYRNKDDARSPSIPSRIERAPSHERTHRRRKS